MNRPKMTDWGIFAMAASFLMLYIFPDGHLDGEKLEFSGDMADMVSDKWFVEAVTCYLVTDDELLSLYSYLKLSFPYLLDSLILPEKRKAVLEDMIATRVVYPSTPRLKNTFVRDYYTWPLIEMGLTYDMREHGRERRAAETAIRIAISIYDADSCDGSFVRAYLKIKKRWGYPSMANYVIDCLGDEIRYNCQGAGKQQGTYWGFYVKTRYNLRGIGEITRQVWFGKEYRIPMLAALYFIEKTGDGVDYYRRYERKYDIDKLYLRVLSHDKRPCKEGGQGEKRVDKGKSKKQR